MKVLINEQLRTIAILSSQYALILREPLSTKNSTPKCYIEFVSEASIPLNAFRDVSNTIQAFIGLIALKGVTYAGFITGSTEVGTLMPHQNVYQLNSTLFISFTGEMAYPPHSEETPEASSSITSINKLLATGTFYYSPDTDLALSMQDRNIPSYSYTTTQSLQEDHAGRFVWNSNLINDLTNFRCRLSNDERKVFDSGQFYTTLIRGFAQSITINELDEDPFLMTLISKQDCRKTGALFGPACVDDDGNIANFVETEVIVYTKKQLFSFVLLRGNVPLFWKLDSHLLSTKIEFPRSLDASKHAFTRFFETLANQYGSIHVVDALSSKGTQPELSKRYFEAIKWLDSSDLGVAYTKIDTGGAMGRFRNSDYYITSLLTDLRESIETYDAFCFDFVSWRLLFRQVGAIIINTLDSNDRANHIQMKISEEVLDLLFNVLDIKVSHSEFWSKHASLWFNDGVALGRLANSYNHSFKTKNKTGGIVGKVAEQSKKYVSGTAGYSSLSNGSGRQTQFDRLLGRKDKELQVELVDPIHDFVLQGLNKRSSEFTSQKELLIYTGTYNVDAQMCDGDLTKFILPEKEEYPDYDLIAIGLEEVVELTPSKIMSIDPSIRLFWEKKVKDTLNQFKKETYTLLRGEQLGGVLLLIFVKADNVDNIKNVETSVKKTGFKGISANKGGVAIAFNYSSHSKLCFVCSHLAAGHSNVEERHQNYKTISKGLRFKKNKTVKDSDVLIWMGDMNFRITLPNETVRNMLENKKGPELQTEINKLYEWDQLNQQMATGESFPFFDEMEIKFPPTYKYDRGTDVFDTSEKQRVPSWTDRILTLTRNKKILQQLRYNSVPDLKFSDHKPVYGIFKASLEIVDEAVRSKIEKELYELRKVELGGDSSIIFHKLDINDGGKVLKHGLPAPSNKDLNSRWWISGVGEEHASDGSLGKAKIRFPELDSGEYIINPKLPKNPFIKTNEPDFIRKKNTV